jgi:hypothetical protein
MSSNLTRSRLRRCLVGGVSFMVVTCFAIFGMAWHLAA